MIEVGQTVGNYRITAKLGEGGMGMVFRAEHPVIGRRAALKAIHPEFALSPEVIGRFVNEAKVISQIGHEHIVDVTDFGRTDDGDFYFIMEHLVGASLAEAIGRGAPLPPARALAIAVQVADALGASHARGVVHRDLKPENVFLIRRAGTNDFVKVLDFGLAKLVDGDAASLRHTSAGMVMGTPLYMAPEQCEGKSEIDGRADVYALGVILFEMLTGMVPFGGDSSGEILVKQVTMRPPAARGVVPDLPEALDVILQRALAKRPEERFPTMASFRAALLDPEGEAGAIPTAARADVSARVRPARPMTSQMTNQMTRGSLGAGLARPPGTRTTFREGVGAFASQPVVALAPAARHRAWLAVAGAALAVIGLAVALPRAPAAGRTPAGAAARAPATIRLTFGSDPTGAEITAPDGHRVGVTPLSLDVPPGDAPAPYVLRKAGFAPKTMSLIPNVSSPVFAVLAATPSSAARTLAAPSRARTAGPAPRIAPRSARFVPGRDDVLAPGFR